MEIPNILVLRIGREFAGKTVPFDKIYFFPRTERELISKSFGYAFVMPVTSDLLKEIAKMPPAVISKLHAEREDNDLKIPPQGGKDWWEKNVFVPYAIEDRLAVIPILLLNRGSKKQAAYLTSKTWFGKQDKTTSRRYSRRYRPVIKINKPATVSFKPAFSELTYLATPRPAPNDKIRPICAHCSRSLLGLQQQCMPGMAVCYTALDFNSINEVDLIKPLDVEKENASV